MHSRHAGLTLHVAILTFDGFNEIDSFVALGLINRLKPQGWSAEITSPSAQATSMNGVTVQAQRPLEFANDADAVLFGSGIYHRAVADPTTERGAWLDRLHLDPLRQLVGAQCSGTLLMARLGLVGDMPACADATIRPWVMQAGVRVIDEPFHARGPVATAGGCMASVYLAAWVMLRGAGSAAAAAALRHAAPVGEKDAWVERVLAVVTPFVEPR